MSYAQGPDVTIRIGDGLVTWKARGRSAVTVAKVLGVDYDESGQIQTLWLDHLLHFGGQTIDGWEATGAISTVLHRTPSSQ